MKTVIGLIVLVIVIVLVQPSVALNAKDVTLDYRGSTLWTAYNDLALQGDYAYCICSFGLMVFDISDSTTLTPAGQLYLPRGDRRKIVLEASRAYISDGVGGLRIIDVSDLSNMAQVGHYDPTEQIYSTAVSGNRAYVGVWDSRMQILDVSDPADIIELGSSDTARVCMDIKVRDNYAITSTWNGGLQIIDISDPWNPELYGSLFSTDQCYGIDIQGEYVAMAVMSKGLRYIDISDLQNPLLAGSWSNNVPAYDAAFCDTVALMANWGSLQVINLAQAPNLNLVATLGSPYNYNMLVRNKTAYYCATDSILAVDLHAVPSLPVVGKHRARYMILDVAVSGDYAYVANLKKGMHILDVSDPTNPRLVGEECTYSASDIVVQGNYAYTVDDGLNRVRTYDISVPEAPVAVGEIFGGGDMNKLDIDDTLLCATMGSSGFVVHSMASPESPNYLGLFDPPGTTWGVDLVDTIVYAACDNGGLRIYDAGSPASIHQEGYFATAKQAMAVAVRDTLAYVATWYGGLEIINVKNPAAMVRVGQMPLVGPLWTVELDGDYAYLGGETDSLWVVDISDPTAPVWAGSFGTTSQARDVAIAGNSVYVANYNGLLILEKGGGIVCGDCDGSQQINVSDLVYMVNYIFAGGPAPQDSSQGDINCTGQMDIADAVYMVNYIFASGPAPCSGCE